MSQSPVADGATTHRTAPHHDQRLIATARVLRAQLPSGAGST
ncbi:hypothetical protein [Plantactinospora sp. WMMB782]